MRCSFKHEKGARDLILVLEIVLSPRQLAECLILSKVDYNDIVGHTIPEYLQKCLQHVQLAAPFIVLGR